ncbi:MAG: WYL domain-containing transcriptional regulator [Candidatus Rokubacteria bacterium]|nr:WYL domain-containing transcriptional regulator [Candidatus Rokubacteria bacterium]
MSRNAQAIRQLSLLRQLETTRGATLQDLANTLPDDSRKHLRTIRRDLEALEAVGFPLVTERVDGQTRWKLIEGYRHIPALTFSPTELMALTFSRHLLKPLEGTQIQASLDSALNKAAAALPPPGLAYVRQLQDLFSVGLGPHKTYRHHRHTIDQLTRAISQARTVQMRYYSASRNTTTRREVDPYRLWYAGGALYLIAYDHRRREVRLFAVDRIRSLTLTDHPYQMPLGFDVDAYVQDALVIMRGKPIAIELLFAKPTAAWVKDRLWHPSQHFTQLKDGRLRMTLQVADTRELVGWILSFGSGVRVMRPDALRTQVREEARKIVRGATAPQR